MRHKDNVAKPIAAADTNIRIAIVVAKFNEEITEALATGAQQAFSDSALPQESVDVFRVPGSVELPVTAAACAETKKYDAIVCVGAVIRGGTDHYHYVSEMAAQGIKDVSLKYVIPVLFGILTCDTQEQAKERCRPDNTNNGYQVALAALRMVETFRDIKKTPA